MACAHIKSYELLHLNLYSTFYYDDNYTLFMKAQRPIQLFPINE